MPDENSAHRRLSAHPLLIPRPPHPSPPSVRRSSYENRYPVTIPSSFVPIIDPVIFTHPGNKLIVSIGRVLLKQHLHPKTRVVQIVGDLSLLAGVSKVISLPSLSPYPTSTTDALSLVPCSLSSPTLSRITDCSVSIHTIPPHSPLP